MVFACGFGIGEAARPRVTVGSALTSDAATQQDALEIGWEANSDEHAERPSRAGTQRNARWDLINSNVSKLEVCGTCMPDGPVMPRIPQKFELELTAI